MLVGTQVQMLEPHLSHASTSFNFLHQNSHFLVIFVLKILTLINAPGAFKTNNTVYTCDLSAFFEILALTYGPGLYDPGPYALYHMHH